MSVQSIVADVEELTREGVWFWGAVTSFPLLTVAQNRYHCAFGASSCSNALLCCTIALEGSPCVAKFVSRADRKNNVSSQWALRA